MNAAVPAENDRPTIDIRTEARAIDRALKNMLAKARAAGIEKPGLYFEAEGGVYVVDTEHADWESGRAVAGLGQKAVIGYGRLTTPHDVGAW